MLGLMQYPQRVLLHKQQKRPRTFLAILKYVVAQQPTDRLLRYSNRPIRCSTELSRYYGRYHEQGQRVWYIESVALQPDVSKRLQNKGESWG